MLAEVSLPAFFMPGTGGATMRAPLWTNSAKVWRRLHAVMTPVWFVLIIPTILWWHDSVLWVGLISCYANAVGHFAAWQGSRAEDNGS